MRELSDPAVRGFLGMSRAVVAKLAGVNRGTLAIYEISPNVVGAEKREACAWVYAELRQLVARAPGTRAAGSRAA